MQRLCKDKGIGVKELQPNLKKWRNKQLLVQMYRTMVRIRVCEESFVEPILNGEIRCPVHEPKKVPVPFIGWVGHKGRSNPL